MQRRSQLASPKIAIAAVAFAFALCVAASAGAADDEGIKITPGKWKMTSVSKAPMSNRPQKNVEEVCLTEPKVKPSDVMDNNKDCKRSNVVVQGNKMTWSMLCASPGGQVSGNAEMTSKGDSISGKMKMAIEHGGMKLNFDNSYEGKRIGACDK